MKFIATPVKGMNDFLPEDMRLRSHVLQVIRNTYRTFGFDEIETPAMEHIENLTGKMGGENEKLIFKVMKRGRELEKGLLSGEIADSGLRYDLTVPLARYYASHRSELPSPMKALQIGNVWRADRPQKGRFRQFTQCDIDIIGDSSAMAEIELITATCGALSAIFSEVGIDAFTVHVNDRRILKSMALTAGFPEDRFDDVFITLDKLDKIGPDGVKESLLEQGFEAEAVERYTQMFKQEVETGQDACVRFCEAACHETADQAAARNVDLILQTASAGVREHVRYDEMIGRFSDQDAPACGFSIGFERIVTILRDLKWQESTAGTEKWAFLVDEKSAMGRLAEVFAKAADLRGQGLCVTVQPLRKNARFQVETLEKNGYTKICKVFADNVL